MVMDQIIDSLNTQTRRQPFTDVTNSVNNCPYPKTQRFYINQGKLGTSDGMSILKGPLSPSNARNPRLSVIAESQAESNQTSTISTVPVTPGKGKRKTHIGPWQLGRTLGKGTTGRVRLAKHSVTGQTAAIKIVSKKSAAMVQSESIVAMDRNMGQFTTSEARKMPFGIEREVIIMKLIEHPNVISLYDVWENRGELYLVLEYVGGGELFDYISSNGPLPEEEAVRLFRQIIAGLAYCHRLNICHRDLKPENILLDSRHNIKLADFGMAALQPSGHWLNTSCGSPHYAAPEIIYGRRYRGDRADIWSCGIILFALLAGFLPFDGGDLASTLRLVKKGEYFLPAWLSNEAADLIQCILQRRPEDRINMQEIWMHPLLKKYENFHQATSDHYIGLPPPLSATNCGPPLRSRQDIDIDILRNLQTLWHGVGSEELIQRLLSSEVNHERMFYNALVRFRDEQLENYQGQPLGYSASDYHHISRPPGRVHNRRNQGSRGSSHTRRSSRVLTPADTNRFKASLAETKSSPTVEGYGPNPWCSSEADFQKAEISSTHSNDSGSSGKQPPLEATAPSVSGIQVERLPSSPFSVLRNRKTRAGSVKSFQSRVSHASPRRRVNSAAYARSVSYRRNVSFRHIRSCPQSPASVRTKNTQVQGSDFGSHPSRSSLETANVDNHELYKQGSPLLPPQTTIVRGDVTVAKSHFELRKVRDSSFVWKDAARKVSHELGQICEEAFNGSSSTTVCATSTCTVSETPSSSASTGTPEDLKGPNVIGKGLGWPSSETTARPPSSPSTVDLTEARRKLIEHSTKEGADGISAYISGVISHLDRLIDKDRFAQREVGDAHEQVRSLPDPFITASKEPGYLPVIAEEMSTLNSSASHLTLKSPEQRALTTGSSPAIHTNAAQSTIRVVPPSSPGDLNPVTVCQNNHASSLMNSSRLTLEERTLKQDRVDSDGLSSQCVPSASRHAPYLCGQEPDEETPKPVRQNHIKDPENKKWSWFKWKPQVHDGEVSREFSKEEVRPGTPTVVVREGSPSEEGHQTLGLKTPTEKPKGGFFRRFIKRKPIKDTHQVVTEPGDSNISQQSAAENAVSSETVKPKKYSQKSRLVTGKSQNWLARFFQVKPAIRVIALNASKVKARKDVYKKLLAWKQYGMEEVYLDKINSVIHGKVGEGNFLRLRPVEFSAEFYTVLEHGRQANLSVVRFKQERGAASTFHKVVDMLCVMLKKRDMLVDDPVRAKNMARVLDGFC